MSETKARGFYAPPAEAAVFDILTNLKEATAPAVYRASEGKVSSVAAAYTLLARLKKRGLVSRREEYFQIDDMPIQRVLYRAIDGGFVTTTKEKS